LNISELFVLLNFINGVLFPMAFFPKEGFGQGGFNKAPQAIKSYISHSHSMCNRPKDGSSLRYSWLTMRPPSRSLWPTERRLQLKVLLAHRETSIRDHYGRPKDSSSSRYSWLTMRPPFAIPTVDRKAAPAQGTLGSP